MIKIISILVVVIVLLIGSVFYFKLPLQNFFLGLLSTDSQTTSIEIIPSVSNENIEVIATNLEVPWEIAFLPTKEMLVTLRKGDLLVFNNNNLVKSFPIEGVSSQGEGGLLGIAVHPQFESNNYLYLYYTIQNGQRYENKVERFLYRNEELTKDKLILEDIRGNIYHNAGKIAFGPDGYLYITAGDALDEPLAQNKSVLAGKILRITDEGEIPSDNPYQNEVYSLGHRNPQGLTWDTNGRLWSSEHGQSGVNSGQDELNLISKGANYGWPLARGSQNFPAYESPIVQSGDSVTWAPGDTEYYAGNIFFTGLRGAGIYKYNILGKNLVKYLDNEFGRLRAITLGPDGNFYLTTSNRDGRGSPQEGDDKILKINPKIFFE
jgi:glucose/arabinose dehydrogenase